MKTEIDISNWNRKEHFEFFSAFDEPFFGITTPIDCTIAMKKAKEIQIPFIDIGHSTVDSVPNHGLCEFKESIGCSIGLLNEYYKDIK